MKRRPAAGLLLLASLPLLTAGGDDREPVPSKEPALLYVRLTVPANALQKLLDESTRGKLFPLDREELDRVLGALEQRQPSPNGALVSTRFEAQLVDDTLRGHAILSFQLADEKPTLAPLSDWALAAQSATWDAPRQGEPASFGQHASGNPAVVVSHSGDLRIAAELRGRRKGDTLSFDLNLPSSLSNQVSLLLPKSRTLRADRGVVTSHPRAAAPRRNDPAVGGAPDAQPSGGADPAPADNAPADNAPAGAKQNGGADKPSDNNPSDNTPSDSKPSDSKPSDSEPSDDELIEWRIELGGGVATRLTVSPQRLPRRPGVQQRTVYQFSESAVEVRSDVRLDGRSPQWDRLELLLGPGLQLLSATSGDQSLDWESDSPERATVLLKDLAPNAATIRLLGVVQRPADAVWRLPSFYLANAVWQESEAVLAIPDSLELRRLGLEGARQIGRSSRQDLTEIFVRHDSPEAVLEVDLEERRPHLEARCGASIRWEPDRLTADAVCIVRTDWREAFELSFQWPVAPRLDRWILDSIQSEPAGYLDLDAAPQPDVSGRLRIPLRRALTPDTAVTFRLRAHRRRPPSLLLTGDQMLVARLLDCRCSADLLAVGGVISNDGAAERVEPRGGAAAELLTPLPGGNAFRVDHNIHQLQSRPDDQRASYAAEATVEATIRQGLLEEVYRIRCSPASKPLDRVTVQISGRRVTPIQWSVDGSAESVATQILDDDLVDAGVDAGPAGSAAAGVERWRVQLPRAREAPFTLVGRRTSPFASGSREILLASAPEALSQSGQVALRCADDVGMRVIDSQLEPLPLPLSDPLQRSRVRGAYRYEPSRPMTLSVSLDPQQLEGLLWCWRSELISRFERSGRCLHDAVFQVENHGRSTFEARVPGNCSLEFAEVDGRRVTPLIKLGVWQVPLPESTTASVHFRYLTNRSKVLAQSWSGALEAPILTPSVPVFQSQWQILLPPEYRTPPLTNWRQRLLGPWSGAAAATPDAARWERSLKGVEAGPALQTWGDLVAALQRETPRPLYVAAESFAERSVTPSSPLAAAPWLTCHIRVTDEGRAVLTPRGAAASSPTVAAATWLATAGRPLWRDGLDRSSADYSGWFAASRMLRGEERADRTARARFLHVPTWQALNWALLLMAAGAAAVTPRMLRPWLVSGLGLAAIFLTPLLGLAAAYALWGAIGGCLLRGMHAAWNVAPPAAIPVAAAVGAALVVAAACGIADDAAPRAPIVVHQLLQPLDEQGQPRSFYYVSLEFLQRFKSELEPAAKAAPKQWLIESAVYRVRLPSSDDPRPRLTADFLINVLEPRSVVRIDLPRGASSLRRAAADGSPTVVQWNPEGQFLSWTAGAASRRQRLQVVVDLPPPRPGADSWQTIQQAIPRLPRARLAIEPSQSEPLEIVAPTARGSVDAAPGELQAELGPVDSLEVRWRPAPRRGATEVEQLTWMKVLPGSVHLENQFHFRNDDAEMRRLRLRVDSSLRLLSGSLKIEGRENTQAVVSKDGGETFLEIPLDPPADEVVLHASFHAVDYSGVGRLPMPVLEAVSDRCTQRWLGVTLHPSLAATPVHGVEMTPLAADDFAIAWGGEELPNLAFRLPLQVDERDDTRFGVRYGRRPGVASEQLHVLLSAETTRVYYEARITDIQSQRFQFEFDAPPELEAESIEVESGGKPVPHHSARTDRGTLTVLLAQAGQEAHRVVIRGIAMPSRKARRDRLIPRLRLREFEIRESTVDVYRSRELSDVRLPATHQSDPLPQGEGASPWAARELAVRIWTSPASDERFPASAFICRAASLADVEADLLTLLTRLDGQWHAEVIGMVQIPRGPQVETLRWEVPQSWAGPFEITPPSDQRVTEIPGKPNRRQLLIRPHQPWTGESTRQLRIRAHLSEEGTGGSLAAPQVELKDVPRVRQYVALPSQADGQQIDWIASGLQAAPAPARLMQELPADTRVDTYRQQERFSASVRTIERVAGAPLVRLADVHLAWEADGRQYGIAHFDLEPAGARHCELETPAGLRLMEATVDGVPASRTPLNEHRMRIRLGPDQLPQRLTVVFEGRWSRDAAGDPRAAAAGESTFSLESPHIADMDTARTLWTVYGPPEAAAGDRLTALPVKLSAQSSETQHDMLRLETTASLVEVAADPLAVRRVGEIESWYAPWARRFVESFDCLARDGVPAPLRQRAESFMTQQEQVAARIRMQPLLQRQRERAGAAALPSEAAWQTLHLLRGPVRATYQGAAPETRWRLAVAEPSQRWELALAVAVLLFIAVFGGSLARAGARWPRLACVLLGLALAASLPWSAIGWTLVAVAVVTR